MSETVDFTYELPQGTDVEVSAEVTPGRPAIMPSMNQPGEPAEDDEAEIISTYIAGEEVYLDDLWLKQVNPNGWITVIEDITDKAIDAFYENR
ncbi:hypothetical protein CMI37_09100 [Candidatus Pacearchaeota archaeon]|nr:hypothetical protein [Candidatus Pacearchaeota archaeon]|tara:strand:- start:1360 stop:1638 length:279 start_codon:yes stop_codon:yes gene_type:complete